MFAVVCHRRSLELCVSVGRSRALTVSHREHVYQHCRSVLARTCCVFRTDVALPVAVLLTVAGLYSVVESYEHSLRVLVALVELQCEV